MKQYRIGDYARYLGVTPDLLKHYEEVGLIQPSRTENGYRYYAFNTAVPLIECIRLRNYGMSLREIREILTIQTVEAERVEQRLKENVEHLREEARLDTLLAEDYAQFQRWKEPLAHADHDWDIRWSRPMCFLPHTNREDFLEDPRIYELLKDWMSYIPIVKSSMKVERDGRMTWGFAVDEENLKRLRLPVNDVVERVPPQKIFYYKFCAPLVTMAEEGPAAEAHPAFQTLRAMNLEGGDTYFRTILMPADWRKKAWSQYGYYAIPLRGA